MGSKPDYEAIIKRLRDEHPDGRMASSFRAELQVGLAHELVNVIQGLTESADRSTAESARLGRRLIGLNYILVVLTAVLVSLAIIPLFHAH